MRIPQPVVAVNFADPGILHQPPHFYVFGTNSKFFRTQTFDPGSLEWYPLELDFGAEKKGVFDVWAFRVYRHTDGSYHGYGAVHYAFFRTVIGHFVPQPGEQWTEEQPIRKWRLDNILVGNIKTGNFAYDPDIVRDDNGDLYLIYSSGSPNEVTLVDIHIKARKLLDPATLDPSFEPRAILSPEGYRSEDRNPGFVQILEGACIRKFQGKWVLFYSAGDFAQPNYKLGVAYSDRLIPPPGETYRKVLIPDPKNLWKNEDKAQEVCYLLQSEKADWPNYVGREVCGPGIGRPIALPQGDVLLFHGHPYDPNGKPTGDRVLWRLPIRIDISPSKPMRDWTVPVLPEREAAE